MPWHVRPGSFGSSDVKLAILLFVVLYSSNNFLLCTASCVEGKPCYPTPKDIAGKRNVTVNSTCGDPVEQFCVELKCDFVCNSNDDTLKHPASYINDRFNLETYWKSKNFDYPVFMQLDLGAIYMLFNSIVTFQHDYHLPAAIYFAKSIDFGSSFQAVAFFAVDCKKSYNMTETDLSKRNGLQVECYKIDANARPDPTSREREIEYGPLRDRITAELLFDNITSAAVVSKSFLVTNIRVMLERFIMPLGVTSENKKSLYFSVKDWDVRVACYCNGQASKCESEGSPNCLCERNTLPPHCNECLPLYNNRTWQFGKPCEGCGCNNHASSCQYNSTKGYGVCVNCTHNTMGEKCQSCKPYYYRNSAVGIDHNETCLACACNSSGITDAPDSALCHAVTGQCSCKGNVEGRACDLCKAGFWNLSSSNPHGCQECGCVTKWTMNNSNVCDTRTGQCKCKPSITGLNCTRCKNGYFGMTVDNPSSCNKCDCSSVGSVNISCNSTGGCYCRPNFYGLKCEQIRTGFFVPSIGELTYEAEDANISPAQEKRINYTYITDTAGRNILVVGVVLSAGSDVFNVTKLTFIVEVPYTGVYTAVLRFMTSANWKMIRMMSLLRTSFSSFSCDGDRTVYRTNEKIILFTNITAGSEFAEFGSGGQCMQKGEYTVDVEIPYGSGATANSLIMVDSFVLLPYITDWNEYKRAATEEKQNMKFYYKQAFGLRQWSGSFVNGSRALAPFFGAMYGEALACNCDVTGSQSQLCVKYGGQCECKPNVIGRQCKKCQPDHYNFASGTGCRACSCNMVGSNKTSCDMTSGQCSCWHGVTGQRCDTCKQFYFNFSSGVGCSPCSCNALYSQDLQCDEAGKCPCKHGVNEDKCTRCADDYYNLNTTGCLACNCELSGSLNSVCNKTTGQCPCKANTYSQQCRSCEYGYYGLNSRNPAGCLKCHCSGNSNNCTMDGGWLLTAEKSKLQMKSDNTKMDGWKVVSQPASQVSHYYWDVCLGFGLANMLQGCIVLEDKGTSDEMYFSAPAKYLGDKRFAYTYSMTFLLQYDNHTNSFNSSKGDVILTGKYFNQVLVSSFKRKPGNRFSIFEVRFVESQWRVDDSSGRHPTSDEMLRVLSSLTAIHIRAKWANETGRKSRLADIKFYYSNRTTVLDTVEKTTNVERCQCPMQYSGQFCEQCSPGYTRVTPNGGAYLQCVLCQCNGHSLKCHPETGVCVDCQHNTTGDHCEVCKDGLYGNATHGTPHDCKKCPCPGPDNQFARTCRMDNDGQPTCDCFPGYHGRRCSVCADGYYGRPWETGGNCKKCDCSDNVDLNTQGNCNTTTGECLKCLNNTAGFNCQWCKAGYHGNALTDSCQKCNCTALGSKDNECHNMTGQCKCWPNVAGITCDQCEVNAFNYTSGIGCTQCECHPQGAILQQCNETTGECSCRANVTGRKCDSCNRGFYDVSRKCIECNCHPNQTVPGTTCDVVTGQCVCNISLGGGRYGRRRCDGCAQHTTGKPPYCKACTERCYFNWWELINKESHAVSVLEKNVTDLLQAFGGLSRDTINSTLHELEKNLSSADQVFSGAQYNLQDKTTQLERIRSGISEYQRRLNESQEILKDTQLYISAVADKFNGTIEVEPVAPNQLPAALTVQPGGSGVTVYADYNTIVSMATRYRELVYGYNSSGYEAYGRIMTSYQMITLANATAAIAARLIQQAITRLPAVDAQRRVAETNLGLSFQASLAASQRKLEEISRVTQQIYELMKNASATGKQAKEMVDQAQSTVSTARTYAAQRRAEAEIAVHNATAAHRSILMAQKHALEAQGNVTEFKTNATGVLAKGQSAFDKVADGINRVAMVTNTTSEANKISAEVQGMRLPVTLQEVQRLANQINSTEVNETAINITYEGASAGLVQARTVEQLSKKAINVSQNALNTVKGVENSLDESERLVREARALQTDTDRMAREIENITNTVRSQFSSARKVGEETIQLINNTIESVDEGLTCFSDAKRVAQNASDTARMAHNVSREARRTYEESNNKIPNATRRVDEAYNNAKSAFTDVEATHGNATKLLQDVMEAQVLLKSYIEQRDEMIQLKIEAENLESELHNVTRQFEQVLEKYNNCNNA